MPARPSGLLEPCAATSGTHGSEGAPAQQCAGATRQLRALRAGRDLRRGPIPDPHRHIRAGHGHLPERRHQPAPPRWGHHHRPSHPRDHPPTRTRPHPHQLKPESRNPAASQEDHGKIKNEISLGWATLCHICLPDVVPVRHPFQLDVLVLGMHPNREDARRTVRRISPHAPQPTVRHAGDDGVGATYSATATRTVTARVRLVARARRLRVGILGS